jgi:murein DD-endopeptidase MepM/ murein hydrolase activator NlpD
MEVLAAIGRWAAQQGASWLLRNRWRIASLVALVGVGAVLVGAGIGASVSGGGSDEQARAACRTLGYQVASAPGGAVAGYVPEPVGATPAIPEGGLVDGFGPGETEQIAVAQAIVAAGTAAGVGTHGMVVAIATALQESGLRELDFGDRDSLGPFQQRPSQGWGTPEEVRDADFSARAFFGGPTSPHFDPGTGRASPGGLLEVGGWEQLPVTVAAQKVQRSAFPNAYAKHEPRAVRIVAALTGGQPIPALPPTDATAVSAAVATPGDGTGATPADDAVVTTAEEFRASGFDIDGFCAANAAAGAPGAVTTAGLTVPPGAWTAPLSSAITSEFGMRLHPVHGVWKLHAGTDFAATVGTPLRAASDGVVSKVTWYGGGGLIVVVDHAGGVQTWFLHLSQVLVKPGDVVTGGQVIALSGNTGVGTGAHFHLETHVGGVSVDPVQFMAERGVDLRSGS